MAAQDHAFPPLILHFCVALYTHSRYICTEETLVAPVAPTRGIVAGCPFAPGLSKLVMHPVMEQLSANPSLRHCDLYIDDSSFDMESKSVRDVVHKSMEIWRHVKQAFFLPSVSRSPPKNLHGFVPVEPSRKSWRPSWGPSIPKSSHAGGTWELTQRVEKRGGSQSTDSAFAKDAARSQKLSQLTTSGRARSKAAKAGVEAAAAYGHQAVGLASKRMAFLRQLTGRMRNGSTEIVLDYRCETKPDPSALSVEQHVRSYVSTVARWPSDLEQSLEPAFQSIKERVAAHKEPWRIASGPIGATLCCLQGDEVGTPRANRLDD